MKTPALNLEVDGKDAARAFVSFLDDQGVVDMVVVDLLYPEGRIRFIWPEDRIVAEVEGFLESKHKGHKVTWRKSKPVEAREYEKRFRALLNAFSKSA